MLPEVEPAHLPLLLASERFESDEETEPLDRLRLQKAVFLLEKRGSVTWTDLFDFTPYNWGPYSRGLARAVSSLVADGLLDKEPFPNRRYSAYRATDDGEEVVDEVVAKRMTRAEREFVRQVRAYVTTRSFTKLLREVYAAYPEYASESYFTG